MTFILTRFPIKIRYLITILILCCSGSVFAQQKSVLLLGDSLSAGYGLQLEQAWFTLLSEELQTERPELKLINASISGDTTGGGLARLPILLETHNPSVLWIELGGNDGLRGYPIKRIEQNINKMIDIAKANNVDVIVTEIQLPPNYGLRYTKQFQQLYHRVSDSAGVKLLPFFMTEIAVQSDLMLPDGIHPNEKAQGMLKDIIKTSLLTTLDSE